MRSANKTAAAFYLCQVDPLFEAMRPSLTPVSAGFYQSKVYLLQLSFFSKTIISIISRLMQIANDTIVIA